MWSSGVLCFFFPFFQFFKSYPGGVSATAPLFLTSLNVDFKRFYILWAESSCCAAESSTRMLSFSCVGSTSPSLDMDFYYFFLMIQCICRCRMICRKVATRSPLSPAFLCAHWAETLAAFCLLFRCFISQRQSAGLKPAGVRWMEARRHGAAARQLQPRTQITRRHFLFSVIWLEKQRQLEIRHELAAHRRRFQFSQLEVLWRVEIFILLYFASLSCWIVFIYNYAPKIQSSCSRKENEMRHLSEFEAPLSWRWFVGASPPTAAKYECIGQQRREGALCSFHLRPGDPPSSVLSLSPSFHCLCVSRRSEASSLAFISISSQPLKGQSRF